jgi:hypothetical protein
LLAVVGVGTAATPKEIDAAVQKGAAYLKAQYKGVRPGQVADRGRGIGEAALAGLALLESGTPIDDPVVKAITAGVRDASFTETRTYHVALCLLYLDRFDDPADVPLIQMLGVRLLAGQNSQGGWTYECVESILPVDERSLRAALAVTELKAGGKNSPPAGKNPTPVTPKPGGKADPAKPVVFGQLHPEVEKYIGKLATTRRDRVDDNSNTQFGILGVWAARKYGVPVEAALDRIERRFLTTQTNGGGWPYSGVVQGSPSMTCAGLLGLATAIGRREERRLTGGLPKQADPFAKLAPKEKAKPAAKGKDNDPFFDPPPAPEKPDDPKKPGAKVPADPRDAAVQRGLASLGAVVAGNARQVQVKGKGKGQVIRLGDGRLGDRDFYFIWSLERVGVIYGLDKIGGADWYDVGADELVPAQHGNGSWGKGANGDEVDTAFALLFLARSNLVRDLSSKVQKDASTAELRASARPVPADPDPAPAPMPTTVAKQPDPADPAPAAIKPPTPAAPADADPKAVAADLIAATDGEWDKALAKARDAKGAAYTQAFVLALRKLEGDRLKAAREALAERLTRMTAETLRAMATDKDAELRRGAVLAMAMKDDKAHLPDLISAIVDDEELVVRAAKAGLKSLTGQDFGPPAGATLAERAAAAKVWLEWLRKQK